MESNSGYIPNNPQFGLQLEYANVDSTNYNTNTSSSSSEDFLYWSEQELTMGAASTFQLPTLDLDPLPSFLQFSSSPPLKTSIHPHQESVSHKSGNDVADVLLSLKNAIVHPHHLDHVSFRNRHHYQPQSSPTGGTVLDPLEHHYHHHHHHHHHHPQFPAAMSVNLSMNMTMHHDDNDNYHHHYQQQSSTAPTQASSMYNNSCLHEVHHHQRNTAFPTGNLSSSSPPYQIHQHQQYSQSLIEEDSFVAANNHQPMCPFVMDTVLSTTSGNASAARNKLLTASDVSYLDDSDSDLPLPSSSLFDSSGKLNVCRICGKRYARPSTLKTHLRTHSGEKPYRCFDCHKSFSQAANLTAHVRTHSGEKPFRCPVCDRRFSQSSSVTTHMRTHSGERPYSCRMCKKAFSDSSTLTKHVRIHSGEKPYECKLCMLRFSQSGNLNRHMRVHASGAATAIPSTILC